MQKFNKFVKKSLKMKNFIKLEIIVVMQVNTEVIHIVYVI